MPTRSRTTDEYENEEEEETLIMKEEPIFDHEKLDVYQVEFFDDARGSAMESSN